MSQIYLSANLKYGATRPTFSIETTDHAGGGYHIGGLHPASIAAMTGRGPKVDKGERFDFKFNANAKRISIALVVSTSKHLPHLEWSSAEGMGKLPIGMGALASLLGGKTSKSGSKPRIEDFGRCRRSHKSHEERHPCSNHSHEYATRRDHESSASHRHHIPRNNQHDDFDDESECYERLDKHRSSHRQRK